MRTLIISTLAVGLIGCATQPKVVMRIVDPYSQIVYDLTDQPCPYQFNGYPFVFSYRGNLEGCYRTGSDAIYFISSTDWRTRVAYTYDQLMQSKRAYESSLGYAIQSVKPSYTPTPSTPVPSRPAPMIQCFSNGFGTVTCY